jgi:hypothetical protein
MGATLATAVTVTSAHAVEPEPNPDFPRYVPTGKRPKATFWKESTVLSQFGIDACEAFAMAGSYLAATHQYPTFKQGNRFARKIWNERSDPKVETAIAGIEAIKIMQRWGMVHSWSMPQTMSDLIDAVCYHGPIEIGVRMTDRFARTDGREIRVGSIENAWEAHAMVATAYVPRDTISGRGPSFRLRNSWGKHWGQNGSSWITVEDLKKNWGPRPYPGYYQDMWAVNWIKP